MSLFALDEVVAGYGRIRVVHGLSLAVEAGQVVALVGRNGAGKTTTLQAAAGMVRVFSGSIRYRGAEITRWPSYRRARLGLGYVPEDRRIFPELTVRENLETGRQPSAPGRPGTKDSWTFERIFQLMPWLHEIEKRRGGFLSGGEQQMLAIARTLMGNPQLLLLDEPTEGLAPHFVRLIGELVATLKSEGLAVLLAEQNLAFINRLADCVYVLEAGELRLAGTTAQLAADPQVRTLLAL
jgi:branched-chain amino acid transport system ATP-binding protein